MQLASKKDAGAPGTAEEWTVTLQWLVPGTPGTASGLGEVGGNVKNIYFHRPAQL